MSLSADSFLGSFGFLENPFVLTNADEEPELQSYFVPPPYFPSVIGSPSRPKSSVVFAPRGGGKTAQKVMIERKSVEPALQGGRFICLTYDSFSFPEKFKAADASPEWHLTNITRLLTAALLVHIDERGNDVALSDRQKSVIAKTARNYLSELDEAEFSSALKAIRSPLGKIADFYDRYRGQVSILINAVATRYGLGSINELDKERNIKKPSVVEYLQSLMSVTQTLGFSSVYILVDRIDEASITQGDSRESFRFIQSLLTDLHVLELEGFAFKFFLWDQVEPHYRKNGARPDRVPIYKINWTVDELRQMLARRLEVYSGGQVRDLNALVGLEVRYDLHGLVATFAAGSPRDMIRTCRAIVDEQTRIGDSAGALSLSSIEKGISDFCNERSYELFPEIMDELLRIGSNSFTISRLASNTFRMTTQAMGRKIQTWVDAGAVVKSGELPSPGNRPQNLYSLADPKLCIGLKGQRVLVEMMEQGMFTCSNCTALNLVDEPEHCYQCRTELKPQDSLAHRFGRGI